MDLRIVVCSLNLWRDRLWSERQPALQRFFERRPDVLAVQELLPATRSALDAMLSGYRRVHDEDPVWSNDCNLYWNSDVFVLEANGAEEFGAVEEYSRLCWVKLRTAHAPPTTVLFATAHFSAGNKPDERRTGVNPRLAEASRCAQHLNRIADERQPIVFLGDLNEDEHVLWRFADEGFSDVCSALDHQPEPINDGIPWPKRIPAVDDWILFRGPIRPMTFEAARYQGEPGLPPAAHRPVLATFSL